jgi:hypothetical protein
MSEWLMRGHFHIYASRHFQRYKEHLKARGFDPYNRALSFWESQRTPKSPFRECECRPHTPSKWGCDRGGFCKLQKAEGGGSGCWIAHPLVVIIFVYVCHKKGWGGGSLAPLLFIFICCGMAMKFIVHSLLFLIILPLFLDAYFSFWKKFWNFFLLNCHILVNGKVCHDSSVMTFGVVKV